jgi:hypothetical protein
MAAPAVEPKRPQSSYFLWLNAEGREECSKALGGVKDIGKVGKLAGEKWKTIPAATKAKYEKINADLKVKYDADMKAFEAAGGVKGGARKEKAAAKAKREDKKQRKVDEADKPKKPAGGAFGSWLAAKRSEIHASLPKGSSVVAVTKAASEKWKAMSEADKKPWEADYQKKKAKYDEDLKAWKAKNAGGNDDGSDDDAEPAAKKGKAA